jgi:hypothetical protein
VVAYAFRDHWMWFNGYSYIGRTFSFIIWKDYNCITWNSVDDTVMSAAPTSNNLAYLVSMSFGYLQSTNKIVNPYGDIWSLG